jgi:hypothetical protein
MRNIGRARRLAGIVAGALLATVATLAMATSAQAAIELSDNTGSPLTDQMVFDGQEIQVHGSAVPAAATGATHVAITLCDIDDATGPADLGVECDATHAIGFTPIANYIEGAAVAPEPLLTVEDEFHNWDFTENQEGDGDTECAGTAGAEDCAVVVSFYAFAPFPVFLHAEAEEVTFEAP